MTESEFEMVEAIRKERDLYKATLFHVIDEIYLIEAMMVESAGRCKRNGIEEMEALGGARAIRVLKDVLPDYNSILKEEFRKRESKEAVELIKSVDEVPKIMVSCSQEKCSQEKCSQEDINKEIFSEIKGIKQLISDLSWGMR